jgi:hypothetical protein
MVFSFCRRTICIIGNIYDLHILAPTTIDETICDLRAAVSKMIFVLLSNQTCNVITLRKPIADFEKRCLSRRAFIDRPDAIGVPLSRLATAARALSNSA